MMIKLNERTRSPKDIFVFFCLATLLLLPVWVMADEAPEFQGPGVELDLAKVKIESEAARKLLGMEYISVRKRRTNYMPEGEIPAVIMRIPSDDEIQSSFKQLGLIGSGKEIRDGDIKAMGNIYSARIGTSSYWISKSSGSYKFTETDNSMGNKTEIGDFKRAVQIALDYIGEHQMITPAEGEEVDILFVSAVRNVLSSVNEKNVSEKPLDEFASDYYVGFGRRFKTVPVWGSRLVIRVDGNGKVVSVFKNWRSFSAYGPEVKIDNSKSLGERIVSAPAFYRDHEHKDVSAKEIYVVDKQCGYLEAPVNYWQQDLRPGCIVSYRIGKEWSESYPQIILPLEEGVSLERLFGRRALEGGGDEK